MLGSVLTLDVLCSLPTITEGTERTPGLSPQNEPPLEGGRHRRREWLDEARLVLEYLPLKYCRGHSGSREYCFRGCSHPEVEGLQHAAQDGGGEQDDGALRAVQVPVHVQALALQELQAPLLRQHLRRVRDSLH